MPYIFPRKCDVVYSNVITNYVICAPFVTTLLKRSGETKIDIALVHLCNFRHCVPSLLDRKLCDKSMLSLCCSQTHTADAGDTLTLDCVPPVSYPPADVYWVIKEPDSRWQAINFDKRVSMDLEGQSFYMFSAPG